MVVAVVCVCSREDNERREKSFREETENHDRLVLAKNSSSFRLERPARTALKVILLAWLQ